MKKILIILLFIPLFSFGQGYSGYYFKASQYLNSPVYKLSGVDLDSANTLKKGFFTKYQYNKLQSAKQKNDSTLNSGFATNYKLSLLYPTSSNTLYGNLAGHSISSGTNNVLVGYRAGYLVSSGTKNVMIGHHAGDQSTAVNYCTFVGNNAGYNTRNHSNTFIGAESGYTNRTGANNTFIGFNSGYSNYSGSGSIMIGYKAGEDETGSNKLYIENSNADSTTALVFGNFLTNKLVFNANVGIGTNAPLNKLDVFGSTKFTLPYLTDSLSVYNDEDHFYPFRIEGYDVTFDKDNITGLKVGIRKKASFPLDVNGSINATSYYLNGVLKSNQFHDSVTIGTANGLTKSGKQKLSMGLSSSSTTGSLSSTDWGTFNSKIGGSGTTGTLAYFTGSGTIGNSPLTTDGTNITSTIIQKSTAAYESATLGNELLTSSNWTSTGWTGDFTSGFTHTTGNTTALTNTLAAVTNNL